MTRSQGTERRVAVRASHANQRANRIHVRQEQRREALG